MKTYLTRAMILLALVVLTASTLLGAVKSKGVPSGWIEDFEEAKAKAAKEGKHILMCCLESDSYWGQRLLRQVFSQGKFSGKAKKRFVLMMVDMAEDAKNLSPTALKQNPKLRSEYNLWGYGGPRIVDCDGVQIKQIDRIDGDANSYWAKLNAETQDLPKAEKKSPAASVAAAEETGDSGKQKRDKRKSASSRRNAKNDPVPEEPISRIPGTGKSTPAGWIDDFYAAQELSLIHI